MTRFNTSSSSELALHAWFRARQTVSARDNTRSASSFVTCTGPLLEIEAAAEAKLSRGVQKAGGFVKEEAAEIVNGAAPAANEPNPTAVQVETVGHETPFTPSICDGIDWVSHVLPRFAEVVTASIPAAMQLLEP